MYPEASLDEEKTAALISQTLTELGIPHQTGIAGHGIVGLIEGAKPGKTVLFRADMDALEMTEEADVEYKSRIPGRMHACGHDGHVAGLLLAAMVLNELRGELTGNVKLMFQPAEETVGGALPMIQAGILENPKVDAAFGCHLWGSAEEGKVWVKSGPTMAAPDEFRIKVIGTGGHGALPHISIDPIVLAGEVVCALQTVVARRINPLDQAVITVGIIQGGTAFNIIPESVTIGGTIRTFDPETRDKIPKLMENLVAGITRGQGGDYELDVNRRYPALINDPAMTALAKASLAEIAGSENVEDMKEANMGGEDFSYLLKEVPGSFFFVGISKDMQNPAMHHNPRFAWDEKALKVSAGGFCRIAFDYLAS